MFGAYRTLLALMVVAMHLGGAANLGFYAVFGFFALSGYLMTLIMHKNYGYTLSGLSKYSLNRFLRIYPLYWGSIALTAILIHIGGEQFICHYHEAIYIPRDSSELLKNILLIFSYRDSPRLNPPTWALTVELFYYLLIGLGLSKNKTVVQAWLSISITYHLAVVTLGLDWNYRYYIIPAASLPFATGAFIYLNKEFILACLNKIPYRIQEYLPLSIFALIILNWYTDKITAYSNGVFFYTNYVLCSFMVAILADRKSLPFVSRKFDKWLGDFSYPIYLIHYQIGLIVIMIFAMFGFTYNRPDKLIMAVSIPLILLSSWILTVSIENPIELVRAKIKDKP